MVGSRNKFVDGRVHELVEKPPIYIYISFQSFVSSSYRVIRFVSQVIFMQNVINLVCTIYDFCITIFLAVSGSLSLTHTSFLSVSLFDLPLIQTHRLLSVSSFHPFKFLSSKAMWGKQNITVSRFPSFPDPGFRLQQFSQQMRQMNSAQDEVLSFAHKLQSKRMWNIYMNIHTRRSSPKDGGNVHVPRTKSRVTNSVNFYFSLSSSTTHCQI